MFLETPRDVDYLAFGLDVFDYILANPISEEKHVEDNKSHNP